MIEALTWVFKQDIRPSWLKFTLVALANCANETGICWPSVAYICQATSQNRKTVIACLGKLVALGLLEDTGERKGATKQVKVYRLIGFLPNSAAGGTVKESRPRHQRVPRADGKSPVGGTRNHQGTVIESRAASRAPDGTRPHASRDEWQRRLDGYDPSNSRKTWQYNWGPRPDAPGHQPLIPPDLLSKWLDQSRTL